MIRWSVFAVVFAALGAAVVTATAVPTKTAKPPVDAKADEARQIVVVNALRKPEVGDPDRATDVKKQV